MGILKPGFAASMWRGLNVWRFWALPPVRVGSPSCSTPPPPLPVPVLEASDKAPKLNRRDHRKQHAQKKKAEAAAQREQKKQQRLALYEAAQRGEDLVWGGHMVTEHRRDPGWVGVWVSEGGWVGVWATGPPPLGWSVPQVRLGQEVFFFKGCSGTVCTELPEPECLVERQPMKPVQCMVWCLTASILAGSQGEC